MTLTPEERAEINRRNARYARGPITEEGKARSRQNALKHGLRAEIVALPQEDPEVVRVRQEAWQDYYRPESPAAQHLVDQCVRATLMSDRCDAYHAAAVSQRVRKAEDRWEDGRADEVARLVALLPDDPATAVRLLARSAHGCRWLIARWERLEAVLDDPGSWNPDDRDEAIRLLGQHPEPVLTRPRYSPEAYVFHLFSLHNRHLLTEAEYAASLKRLLDPAHMPYAFRTLYEREALPTPEQCRAALREIAAERLEGLRIEEGRMRREVDEPDRAEAADRASILPDTGEARLFFRYHSEARSTFHRAYREMVQALLTDKGILGNQWARNLLNRRLAELDIAADVPRRDGSGAVGVGDTTVSPNEPKSDGVAGVEGVSAQDPGPTAPAPGPDAGTPDTRAVVPSMSASPSPTSSISPNEPKSDAPPATAGGVPSAVREAPERVAADEPVAAVGSPRVVVEARGACLPCRDAGDGDDACGCRVGITPGDVGRRRIVDGGTGTDRGAPGVRG